jgi:catechol 2,3-dioxygenase-like lactoylglutathione lyase family enzyme
MVGYVTLGTNDFRRSTAFFDAPCEERGGNDEGARGPRGAVFHACFHDLGNELAFFMLR